jgi:hypothetical protein
MQAQILFLKGPELASVRNVVAAAVERRHAQVRELWTTMLKGMDIDPHNKHVLAPAPAYQKPLNAPASLTPPARATAKS